MDDWKQDKQQTVTRLAICVVIAVVLYVVMDKFGDKLPLPDGGVPGLEQHKIQGHRHSGCNPLRRFSCAAPRAAGRRAAPAAGRP